MFCSVLTPPDQSKRVPKRKVVTQFCFLATAKLLPPEFALAQRVHDPTYCTNHRASWPEHHFRPTEHRFVTSHAPSNNLAVLHRRCWSSNTLRFLRHVCASIQFPQSGGSVTSGPHHKEWCNGSHVHSKCDVRLSHVAKTYTLFMHIGTCMRRL